MTLIFLWVNPMKIYYRNNGTIVIVMLKVLRTIPWEMMQFCKLNSSLMIIMKKNQNRISKRAPSKHKFDNIFNSSFKTTNNHNLDYHFQWVWVTMIKVRWIIIWAPMLKDLDNLCWILSMNKTITWVSMHY